MMDARSTSRRSHRRFAQGFTLTEVLVSTTILGLAVGMTMVVFLAALKRAKHTENALKGTAELRYASDAICQAVRSASQFATVGNSGLQLTVPPPDLGYAIVQETTWLDAAHTVKGSKSNQRMLKVGDFTTTSVIVSVWKANGSSVVASSRPAGAIAASDVATYFVGATDLPTMYPTSFRRA